MKAGERELLAPPLAALQFELDAVVGRLHVILHRNASIQEDDSRQQSHKLLSDIKTFRAPHAQAALHVFCHQCDAVGFPLLVLRTAALIVQSAPPML